MKSQVLHTVWCNISGEAAGEIWNWPLVGVKGLMRSMFAGLISPTSKRRSRKYSTLDEAGDWFRQRAYDAYDEFHAIWTYNFYKWRTGHKNETRIVSQSNWNYYRQHWQIRDLTIPEVMGRLASLWWAVRPVYPAYWSIRNSHVPPPPLPGSSLWSKSPFKCVFLNFSISFQNKNVMSVPLHCND